MSGLLNNISGESSVTISNQRFEKLIRNSERLEMIKEHARKHKYISAEDMMILLGIVEEGEE